MFSQTITFFNRKKIDEGDVWYPTVIRNVHVDLDRAAVLAKYGPKAADNAALYVPYSKDIEGNILVAGKCWLPPKEWAARPEIVGFVTFTPGDRFDFFWLGDWGSEEAIYDADHVADMGFYNHMNRLHDFVFAVTSVGGPYRLIPHFEIMGK